MCKKGYISTEQNSNSYNFPTLTRRLHGELYCIINFWVKSLTTGSCTGSGSATNMFIGWSDSLTAVYGGGTSGGGSYIGGEYSGGEYSGGAYFYANFLVRFLVVPKCIPKKRLYAKLKQICKF